MSVTAPTLARIALPLALTLVLSPSLIYPFANERSAFAAAPDVKTTAQRKAKEGQRLAETGQHAAALSLFKEAYETYQEPGYLYNMGLAYEALGRDVQALDAFERFLRDVQKMPPEFVADANQRRRDIRQRVGDLEIHCAQPGALVRVDDVDIATTPVRHPIRLKAGSHQLALSKAGFDTIKTTVEVTGGASEGITLSMRPVAASASGPNPLGAVPASSSERDRVEANAAPPQNSRPPPAFSIYAGAGAGFWTSGIPGNPGASLALSAGADGRIVSLSKHVELRLGLRGGLSFISERVSDELFGAVLVNPKLSIAVVPERFVFFVEAGAGLLMISGLASGSALLRPEATDVQGAISTLQIRPGLGMSYAISRGFGLYAAGGVAWSPAPSQLFVEPSMTQLDATLGFAVGID
jgi:hypothetical protein